VLETQHRSFRFKEPSMENKACHNGCLRAVLSMETWQESFQANNEIFRMETRTRRILVVLITRKFGKSREIAQVTDY